MIILDEKIVMFFLFFYQNIDSWNSFKPPFYHIDVGVRAVKPVLSDNPFR